MNIESKFLGEVEINEHDVLTFVGGLPGFEEQTKYVLLPVDADLPLALLQSIEEPSLGFVVALPFAFKKDYAFDLSESDKETLQIEKEEDVLVYSIITLKENFDDSTLNLLAPVVININKSLGKQIVLEDNAKYPVRYSVKEFVTANQ